MAERANAPKLPTTQRRTDRNYKIELKSPCDETDSSIYKNERVATSRMCHMCVDVEAETKHKFSETTERGHK